MCARARLTGCRELFIPPPCCFVGVTLSHLSAPREEKRRFLRRVLGFVVRLFKESWRLQFFNSLFFFFFYPEEFNWTKPESWSEFCLLVRLFNLILSVKSRECENWCDLCHFLTPFSIIAWFSLKRIGSFLHLIELVGKLKWILFLGSSPSLILSVKSRSVRIAVIFVTFLDRFLLLGSEEDRSRI